MSNNDPNLPPVGDTPSLPAAKPAEPLPPANTVNTTPATPAAPLKAEAPAEPKLEERIDRLAGEPAPDISPEEFARLQKAGGAIHLDAKGRIRPNRPTTDDPGVSLRKRRAWY